MSKFRFWVIGCMLVICLPSCRKGIVYSHFYPIPEAAWHIDSTMHFDFAIRDTNADYRTIVYVRHTECYPYQNMWLFVGDSMRCDTIEFYLADDRGQWLGDRHHGFIEMPVLLEENRHFADTGIYPLHITHAMRDSVLRGVTDIGLEITKVTQ